MAPFSPPMLSDPDTVIRLLGQLAPHGFYLRREDNLRLTAFNSAAGVTLSIRSRTLTLAGEIIASADQLVPTTARAASTLWIPAGDGWLLDAQVIATAGTPRIGQCFAVLDVVRGDATVPLPLACLAQGYVTD